MSNMENGFDVIEIEPSEEVLFRIQRHVAAWVTGWLRANGKSQTWLAEKMGKKQSYINRILANGGANLTLKTIAEIEVAIGVPVLLTLPEFEYRAIHTQEYWSYLVRKRDDVLGLVSQGAAPTLIVVSAGHPIESETEGSSVQYHNHRLIYAL